jgi:hypothetical protein
MATDDGYISTSDMEDDATQDATRRTAMSLVARTRRLLGASSCTEYSARSYNNQRSFNAIIYSRLSSSSTIDEHVSSLMEVVAIVW